MAQYTFSIEQQSAFTATAKAMRERGGQMQLADLTAVAKAHLNIVAPGWPGSKRKIVAGKVAKSIAGGFDLAKVRAKPKQSRAEKALRDRQIEKYYHGAEGTARPSCADIATKFGISRTAAHRILRAAKLLPDNKSHLDDFSEDTKRLLELLDRCFPYQRYRLLSSGDLKATLGFDRQATLSVIELLSKHNHTVQIIDTDRSTGRGDGSSWLVIQRGKIKSEKALLDWALAKIDLMKTDPRGRSDQSAIFRLANPIIHENSVFSDLCTVLLIASGSENLNVWSKFVQASTTIEKAETGAIYVQDTGAILTVVNGAIRRQCIDDRILDMHDWLPREADRAGAKKLFELVDKLRTGTFFPAADCLSVWIESVSYRTRISCGELSGRNVSDLNILDRCREIDDFEELFEMLAAAAKEQGIESDPDEIIDHKYLDDGYIYPIDDDD